MMAYFLQWLLLTDGPWDGPGDWATETGYKSLRRASTHQGIDAKTMEAYLCPPGYYISGRHSGFNWLDPLRPYAGGGIQLYSKGIKDLMIRVW